MPGPHVESRPGSLDSEAPTPVLDERAAQPAPNGDPFPFAGHRHPALDLDSLAPAGLIAAVQRSLPPTDRSLLSEAGQGSWVARLVLAAVGVNLFALGMAVGMGLRGPAEAQPAAEPAVLAPVLSPTPIGALGSSGPEGGRGTGDEAGGTEPTGGADPAGAGLAGGAEPASGESAAGADPATGIEPGAAADATTARPVERAAPPRSAAPGTPVEPVAAPSTWGPFEAGSSAAPPETDKRKLVPLGRRR